LTGFAVGGRGEVNTTFENNWINDNILTYTKKISDHSFSILGGFTQQYYKAEGAFATSTGFVTDELTYNNLELGSAFLRPSSQSNTSALQSFISRATYNYKDKYLFTATARADGSSKFGADHKWGYFPSGSVKWRISEEGFLRNSKSVNELALRASYGITGSEALASYQSLATLNNSLNYIFGNNVYVGVALAGFRIQI
jgi:hypothetical protein